MNFTSKSPKVLFLLALAGGSASAALAGQSQELPPADLSATVSAPEAEAPPPAPAAELTKGPEIEGFISARSGDRMQVTTVGGTNAVVALNDATQIKASKGFLGLDRDKLTPASLVNGLPVTVKTLQAGDGLIASQIALKNKDLRTAAMILNGTDQRFGEQAAATEALRGRMGDIDKYNIKSTTNVNFGVGQTVLSPQAKNDLCATASAAEGMNNALLLVVGYTDSTGSAELNQVLSEKRAGRVVNYLQQVCGWKPYRMLTPAGMASADPLGSNDTREGQSQNRRVSVNVMVSKGLDGL